MTTPMTMTPTKVEEKEDKVNKWKKILQELDEAATTDKDADMNDNDETTTNIITPSSKKKLFICTRLTTRRIIHFKSSISFIKVLLVIKKSVIRK